MADTYNVFISWSGERSRRVADALRAWLPIVLQAARPWMSAVDIDKGARGLDEVGKALEGMKVGIICLTPENLGAPWILYEAGALSKTFDVKTRLCTFLLPGLEPQDVKPPLGMFQWTRAEKEDSRKLVHAINRSLEAGQVSEANLNALFDGMWPQLEGLLEKMPGPEEIVESKRSVGDMIAEVLELSRDAANRRKATERLDTWIPVMEQLLPFLSELAPQLRATSPLRALAAIPITRVEPRKIYSVKLEYEDEVKRIEGTHATEAAPGRLLIFDGANVVARFTDGIERWWTEAPSGATAELPYHPPPSGIGI